MPIAVLMYHGIGEPADPSEGTRYTVTRDEWREQVGVLAGTRVLAPSELLSRHDGVVLTFDDGEESVLSLAAPALRERSLPAIVFMTSGFLGKPHYLDAMGLRELASLGFEVGAHGATHRFLNTLNDAELDEELSGGRKRLEDVLGRAITDLSLPGGRGGARVSLHARHAGYKAIYTSLPGWNGQSRDCYAIRRTIVRRGMSTAEVRRLAECDLLLHARDVWTMTARGLVRTVVGENRYHKLTAAVLTLLGRR